jgi:hypothetical protein
VAEPGKREVELGTEEVEFDRKEVELWTGEKWSLSRRRGVWQERSGV